MRSFQGTGKKTVFPCCLGMCWSFCVAFRCQISVWTGTECHGYLPDFTCRSEGGKMRRSDGLQQLKCLLLVTFSGVIFPYYIPVINGIGYLFSP